MFKSSNQVLIAMSYLRLANFILLNFFICLFIFYFIIFCRFLFILVGFLFNVFLNLILLFFSDNSLAIYSFIFMKCFFWHLLSFSFFCFSLYCWCISGGTFVLWLHAPHLGSTVVSIIIIIIINNNNNNITILLITSGTFPASPGSF